MAGSKKPSGGSDSQRTIELRTLAEHKAQLDELLGDRDTDRADIAASRDQIAALRDQIAAMEAKLAAPPLAPAPAAQPDQPKAHDEGSEKTNRLSFFPTL